MIAALPSDPYYSPWRIRTLLRDLPTLLSQHHREEPEPRGGGKRPARTSWGWLEDAVIKHADVTKALEGLPPFTRLIVYKAYVIGESDRHLALVLRCDRETVKRHRLDGLEMMANLLGWRGDIEAWRRQGGRR
jgi:DNA-directed RNA polymerase specialized sigma24 family protein